MSHFASAAAKPAVVLAFLLSVFVLQSYTASLKKSAVWDEPVHIAAGLSYVESGHILLNQQHPPLLKEISGIFLRASGVRWPMTQEASDLLQGALPLTDPIANQIVAENGPDRVMFWARLPFIFVAAILGLVLYLLGTRLLGEATALSAVFLYVLDPTILAHSYLVTTDVGVAAFIMLFLLTLWDYLERPGWARMLWCGLALAAALGSKFSAVAMLPVAVMLLLAAAFRPAESVAPAGPFSRLPKAGPNVLCPCGSGTKYKHCHGKSPTKPSLSKSRAHLSRYGLAFAGMIAIAFLILQALYLFPKDAFAYVTGLELVNADHSDKFMAYMAGHLAPRFYSYTTVAYLLKEPLPNIFLMLIGLIGVLWRRPTQWLALVFLLVPPAALFAGYTFFSDNAGVRYIIPVLPFTYLLGGIGLVTLVKGARPWNQVVAGLLCSWSVIAAVGIYPDHLSYFNETACLLSTPSSIGLDGGSRCGPYWLADSNVDWGQGLKQLKDWLDRNARDRKVRLAYFGHLPPEAYGIQQEPMSGEDFINPHKPGLYILSAHALAYNLRTTMQDSEHHNGWLKNTRPTAIVGHAYYIYDFPGDSH